jgi:Fe-S cluster biosynthesis and repair protein YggX
MDTQTRINQFRQMAEADPDNELGHFSLGKALLETGQAGDAVGPLTRTIELNPRMSKAYQLLGEALRATGREVEAVQTLTEGVRTADAQGDLMPRNAMAKLLGDLGADVPEPPAAAKPAARPASEASAGAGDFRCKRCGRPGAALEGPPFPDALGEKILANICQGCWEDWVGMGTKVINELGLQLADPKAQDMYDQHLVEFLQLEDV